MRAAFEWLLAQAESEADLDGAPPESLRVGWLLVDIRGSAREITMPLVDMSNSTILWEFSKSVSVRGLNDSNFAIRTS